MSYVSVKQHIPYTILLRHGVNDVKTVRFTR